MAATARGRDTMNRWVRLGLLVVSLLLFGLILWWAGPETWQVVLRGDRTYFFTALLIYGMAGVASSSRLHWLTKAVSERKNIPWRRIYIVNWTARALGLVLPRSVSTIGGKAVALKALGVPLRQAVWIVFIDNAFDLLLLGLWVLPAVWWLQKQTQTWVFWLVLVLMVMVAGLLVWWGTQPGRLEPFLRQVRRFPRLTKWLNLDENSFIPTPAYALPSLVWTVVLHLILIISFYTIGQAVASPAALPLIASGYPFVQLSLIVAFAPGGLGLFDLGWLGLLRLGGLSESEALAFVVAQRAYVYVFVLVWALFSVTLSWLEKGKTPDEILTN